MVASPLVVYWPPTPLNMLFQRPRKCIFHWRGWAWLTIWDRVKISRYSHRLMHRKRVTCELHDSYFRWWRSNMPFQRRRKCIFRWPVMGRYWVGVELLYNSVHRKFNQFGDRRVWRRCGRESQHPAESWAPGPPVEQPWRTGEKRWWP